MSVVASSKNFEFGIARLQVIKYYLLFTVYYRLSEDISASTV